MPTDAEFAALKGVVRSLASIAALAGYVDPLAALDAPVVEPTPMTRKEKAAAAAAAADDTTPDAPTG